MRKAILYLGLVLFAPLVFADSSLVMDLVFVTEPQSIAVGAISKEITVQTQNSSGTAEKVSETNDISFSSTSSTGQFLNSSGGAVSGTMSKNTSSRTFYYRDQTEGEHTITVIVTGRETGKIFSATQKIYIGQSALPDESEVDRPSTGISAHSAQNDVSSKSSGFKIDAGRKRIVTINTPIYFTAQISGSDKNSKQVNFDWSFGDGTGGEGRIISHTYQFAGDYIVVASATRGAEEATTRTEVKVIDPKISIESFAPGKEGYVQIKNNSSEEVNIGEWQIKAGDQSFRISKDTIMRPSGALRLPFEARDSVEISLFYPTSDLAANYSVKDKDRNHMTVDERTEILRQIASLQNELNFKLKENIKSTAIAPVLEDASMVNSESESDQTATLIEAFEDQEEGNEITDFFKKLFGN